MGKPIRVLIVEDDERDAQLVLRELKRGGFDVTHHRVETPETMSAALLERHWDLIISDYSMPRFNAVMALAVLKEHELDLPFIIVSGTVGEDIAVEALHAGAHDFVAKGKLARLLPAIDRELRDVALRVEQAKMKEQLLISERMASVGTLAAGVAHEINNPLAALMANLTFAADDIAALTRNLGVSAVVETGAERTSEAVEPRLREIESHLQQAQESAERVRRIVKDLKVFSRGDEERTTAIDVRPVLQSAVRMAWNEVRHRARLVENYGDVPLVEGIEGRLGQVFLNLIINAAQAIPEGNAGKHEIGVTTKQDDRGRVVVEIRDTGSGMPEAIMSRIFDPFFTTKPVGVGTGLGLAICHRIITSLGGQISVESEEGKGTTVRTILPVALAAAEGEVVESLPVIVARRGKILIVDDEPMLANAIRRMLAAEHDVVVVPRARDALARIAGGERFDVVLCDLMMPEVTGMDLHAELLQSAPDQVDTVVFMTGGAFTNRARNFLDQVTNERVEKPFDMTTIKALVQRMMQAP